LIEKSKIQDELNFVSDKLSSQVRTTALGALALSWGLLVGESKTAQAVADDLKWNLLAVGGLAVLTLFFDFLQYFEGYLNARSAFKNVAKDDKGTEVGQYDDKAWSYRLRKFFFFAKMIVLAIDVGWLLFALGRWLILNYS
jgi:hypothetical protein